MNLRQQSLRLLSVAANKMVYALIDIDLKILSLVKLGRLLQASVSAERTEGLKRELSNEIIFIFFFPSLKADRKN